MAQKLKIFAAVTVLFALLIHTTTALAIPSLPSSFYGTVKFNGANVPDGTLVEASIKGQNVAQGYTQTYQGESVYSLDVRGDDTDTAVQDGGIEGDIINFNVGGLPAVQTGTWHAGTNVSLNLTVVSSSQLGSPNATPTAIATQTPIAYQQNGGASEGDATKSSNGIIQKPAIIVLAVILVSLIIGAVWFYRKKLFKGAGK
jgi:hypothetical protein